MRHFCPFFPLACFHGGKDMWCRIGIHCSIFQHPRSPSSFGGSIKTKQRCENDCNVRWNYMVFSSVFHNHYMYITDLVMFTTLVHKLQRQCSYSKRKYARFGLEKSGSYPPGTTWQAFSVRVHAEAAPWGAYPPSALLGPPAPQADDRQRSTIVQHLNI